jgi:hypothetical protein
MKKRTASPGGVAVGGVRTGQTPDRFETGDIFLAFFFLLTLVIQLCPSGRIYSANQIRKFPGPGSWVGAALGQPFPRPVIVDSSALRCLAPHPEDEGSVPTLAHAEMRTLKRI